MVKVNQEYIISALFLLGFDKVSDSLFSYVLGKVVLEENGFVFSDEDYCGFFKSVVMHDEYGFRLKNGYTLSTNISLVPNTIATIRDTLNAPKALITYLNNIDYKEYILSRIRGYESGENYSSNEYSIKEKRMIADMFGYDDMLANKTYEESVANYSNSQEKKKMVIEALKEAEQDIKSISFDGYEPRFYCDEKGVIRSRKK